MPAWFSRRVSSPWGRLLRQHWPALLGGVLGVVVALGGFWFVVERSLQAREQAARDLVVQRVESRVNTYAVQLEHLSDQLHQVAQRLMRQWSGSPAQVDLLSDVREGLLPPMPGFAAFILDAEGRVAQASFKPQLQSGAQLSFFLAHQNGCCPDWLVVAPEYGPIIGREVVRFTRRLSSEAGVFAGVLVLAVPPDFLKSFEDGATMGPRDFVSVRLAEGALVTMKRGNGQPPIVYFKQDPRFVGNAGARLITGAEFKDGLARYVAWRRLPLFPLVAIAAITEADALAPVQQAAAETRAMAGLTSLALLMAALAGMVFYGKWMIRRINEDDMRHTYRVATDAAQEGFYMLRVGRPHRDAAADLRVDDCNLHGAQLLGKTRLDVVGQPLMRVLPPPLREDLMAFCRRALQHGPVEEEWRVPTGSGLNARWIYRRAVHAGQDIALTLRDISGSKHHEAELVRIANHDTLTGLPNRHWLMHALPKAIERARQGQGQLAVLFIDLDNFKLVNDTLGHDAGDALLAQAADRIRHAVRETDLVIRWGGDEFTVVLEHAEQRDTIVHVASKIVAVLDAPFALAGAAANEVSASVGVAIYPMHGNTTELLLKHADVAMYAAKTAGKSRLMLYQPQMSSALYARLDRERALREALEQGQFVMHYQPRVRAGSGILCSFEALVRWQPPGQGLRMPSEFIDLAEETGLISALGDQVLVTVLGHLAAWQRAGLPLVPVSVNVSPAQLKVGGVAARIKQLLTTHGLSSQWVEVEVTETAIVERSAIVSAELEGLRLLGVRLMIDDFGSGHSSLAQLHRLRVDTLKVDKAFTELLARGSDGELLYEAIISMASAMQMRVVAEGVETDAQRYLLHTMGCDEVQGYVIAPAVPAEQVPAMLRRPSLAAAYTTGVVLSERRPEPRSKP